MLGVALCVRLDSSCLQLAVSSVSVKTGGFHLEDYLVWIGSGVGVVVFLSVILYCYRRRKSMHAAGINSTLAVPLVQSSTAFPTVPTTYIAPAAGGSSMSASHAPSVAPSHHGDYTAL
jgi:hypothetical protein